MSVCTGIYNVLLMRRLGCKFIIKTPNWHISSQLLAEQLVTDAQCAGLEASLTDLANIDPEQCLTQQVRNRAVGLLSNAVL